MCQKKVWKVNLKIQASSSRLCTLVEFTRDISRRRSIIRLSRVLLHLQIHPSPKPQQLWVCRNLRVISCVNNELHHSSCVFSEFLQILTLRSPFDDDNEFPLVIFLCRWSAHWRSTGACIYTRGQSCRILIICKQHLSLEGVCSCGLRGGKLEAARWLWCEPWVIHGELPRRCIVGRYLQAWPPKTMTPINPNTIHPIPLLI